METFGEENACEQCGSHQFHIDNGLKYCSRGHQQEGPIVAEDEADFGNQGRTSRVRKEKVRIKVVKGKALLCPDHGKRVLQMDTVRLLIFLSSVQWRKSVQALSSSLSIDSVEAMLCPRSQQTISCRVMGQCPILQHRHCSVTNLTLTTCRRSSKISGHFD